MSHLTTERLAVLVDESPSSAELAHLAVCAECARERAVFRNLVELASTETARLGVPLTNWESLRRPLLADGTIGGGRGQRTLRPWLRGPWLQTAAALLLVVGGVAAGRYSADANLIRHAAPAAQAADTAAVNTAVAAADSAPRFASVEQARAEQTRSQLVYQSATAYLAQSDTATRAVESASAMRTRLAALDQASRVMGRALDEAPYDPVINGYYITTLGQREATIRQLNTALPVSMKITSY